VDDQKSQRCRDHFQIWLKPGNTRRTNGSALLWRNSGIRVLLYLLTCLSGHTTYTHTHTHTHADTHIHTHTLCRAPAKSRGDRFLSVEPRPEWKSERVNYGMYYGKYCWSVSWSCNFFHFCFTFPWDVVVVWYKRQSYTVDWIILELRVLAAIMCSSCETVWCVWLDYTV